MTRTVVITLAAAAILAYSPAYVHARPTAGQKCAAARMRCFAKEFSGLVKCEIKGALTGQAAAPECIAGARGKFSSCYQKADSKGGCPPADRDHLETELVDWAADVGVDNPTQ